MRKKILKGVFCSALSIVMATGGVFVSVRHQTGGSDNKNPVSPEFKDCKFTADKN